MSYNLFLDDIRMPKDAWIYPRRDNKNVIISGKSLEAMSGVPNDNWQIVRSYEQFVSIIEKRGIPDVVSFDHDLSEEYMDYYFSETCQTGIIEYENLKSNSGYHCAQFLCKICLNKNIKFPKYYIHSANQWGSKNIKNYIQNFLKTYAHLQS